MSVTELIEKLKTMPPEALVVAESYETGFDSIKKVNLLAVEINSQKNLWDRQYIDSDNPEALQVIFIDAETKNNHHE